MELSPKQKQVIRHAVEPGLGMIAGGAVRSGKTLAQIMSAALWCAREGIGYDTVLLGSSVESAMRNVGYELIKAFHSLGIKADYTQRMGTKIRYEAGGRTNNIWVIGSTDGRSVKRLQGSTLKGLIVDEVVLLQRDVWNMSLSRLSEDGAKLWATFNPAGPGHWFKRDVIDEMSKLDCKLVHFTMNDNPSLSQEVKDRYNRSFHGHFKKRFIDGEWAGASGLVFPKWSHGDMHPRAANKPSLALDWGISHRFACLMVKDRTVVSEYIHDSNTQGYRTELEHVEAVVAWVAELHGEPQGIKVWVDPSTPATFKRLLRKQGFTVAHADNSVVPGIVTTNTQLANGDLLIHANCKELIREMEGYTWDEKKSDLGEDAPTKMNDHCCDALRYYAHSTGKLYRGIGRLPSAKILMGKKVA